MLILRGWSFSSREWDQLTYFAFTVIQNISFRPPALLKDIAYKQVPIIDGPLGQLSDKILLQNTIQIQRAHNLRI